MFTMSRTQSSDCVPQNTTHCPQRLSVLAKRCGSLGDDSTNVTRLGSMPSFAAMSEVSGFVASMSLSSTSRATSRTPDVTGVCETGLGKAAGGEGLLGLQRSFQAAGARTVVASLWSVPDEETRALMEAFYTNLWQRNLSPLESLRQAQLAMLRSYDPQAGRLRAPDFSQTAPLPTGGAAEKPATGRPKTLSPTYWAAFVLSGDWR